MRKKARARYSHASEDSVVASKSFARRRARLIQPSVRSTTQRFGSTTKSLICLSAGLPLCIEGVELLIQPSSLLFRVSLSETLRGWRMKANRVMLTLDGRCFHSVVVSAHRL